MSHVKLAISPARRPALAGDMASKPSGLHLEMVICQFESSQPSHTVPLFWRVGCDCPARRQPDSDHAILLLGRLYDFRDAKAEKLTLAFAVHNVIESGLLCFQSRRQTNMLCPMNSEAQKRWMRSN